MTPAVETLQFDLTKKISQQKQPKQFCPTFSHCCFLPLVFPCVCVCVVFFKAISRFFYFIFLRRPFILLNSQVCVCVFGAVQVDLVGSERINNSMGFSMFFVGLGCLTGPPLAGERVDYLMRNLLTHFSRCVCVCVSACLSLTDTRTHTRTYRIPVPELTLYGGQGEGV